MKGNGPPPILVMALIRGLPDDSMFHALRLGGEQFLGWGTNRHLLASIFDAISVQTVVTGNWKKSPPKPDVFPRPKRESVDNNGKKKKATVADLFGRLQAKLGR